MYSKKNVVEAFLNQESLGSLNLFSDGTRLMSYGNCLAEWSEDSLIINYTYYRDECTKHLNLLERLGQDYDTIKVLDIPIGAEHLIKI